jgi:E3 ubiquitin-protein ligase RNF14
MADDTADVEDEREIELSSISAIFPEITLDALDPFSASIQLPVTPSLPLPVVFLEPTEGPNNIRNDPGPQFELPFRLINDGHDRNDHDTRLETHYLSHLPSLHLRISLPKGYPSSQPPVFDLSTTPQWLSATVLERLQVDGIRLWEELGHDQVVFAYIDHLQQGAENAFGLLDGRETIQVSQDLKIALLDFDINAKRAAFEKETFTCGVCLGKRNIAGIGHFLTEPQIRRRVQPVIVW